jgi:hypothetical protein
MTAGNKAGTAMKGSFAELYFGTLFDGGRDLRDILEVIRTRVERAARSLGNAAQRIHADAGSSVEAQLSHQRSERCAL